tara:strand:+ start:11153 stop:12091 length:939 start_codon:yes stop_codon:yes gene_type:complete
VQKDYLISIMGPTGVGKTHLAIELSKILNSSIISVDSVQVYKKLDIGSGKPSKEDLKKYPHRLIDIKEPTQPYSTAQFNIDVSEEIQEINFQQKIPLLVGGTMLYFNSFIKGLANLPSADVFLREKLKERAAKIGWPEMHTSLLMIDKESALKIDKNDSQRIQRALEVYELTGQPLSKLIRSSKPSSPNKDQLIQFAIFPESREILRQIIKKRFLDMIEKGFIKEVKKLKNSEGVHRDLPSMRSVGYRQIWEYLEKEISEDEMIYNSINASRKLAKRQMTWLRSWKQLIWLPQNTSNALQLIIKELDTKNLL